MLISGTGHEFCLDPPSTLTYEKASTITRMPFFWLPSDMDEIRNLFLFDSSGLSVVSEN